MIRDREAARWNRAAEALRRESVATRGMVGRSTGPAKMPKLFGPLFVPIFKQVAGLAVERLAQRVYRPERDSLGGLLPEPSCHAGVDPHRLLELVGGCYTSIFGDLPDFEYNHSPDSNSANSRGSTCLLD